MVGHQPAAGSGIFCPTGTFTFHMAHAPSRIGGVGRVCAGGSSSRFGQYYFYLVLDSVSRQRKLLRLHVVLDWKADEMNSFLAVGKPCSSLCSHRSLAC